MKKKNNHKLLLHICCAGCGAFVSQLLKKDFEVTLCFFNPNIYPASEYQKRKAEVEKIAALYGLPAIIEDYDHGHWLKTIEGKEDEPEKGLRCYLCYQSRLEKTAKIAKRLGFNYFSTTLSVSPHKVYKFIKEIGGNLAKENSLIFYDQDFKKKDGFKMSKAMSDELELYRQNYCGCEFSQRAS